MRSILLYLHRYIGLAMALFLALAGLTGTILAFHHELDEWLNPDLYHTGSSGPALPPDQLVERVESAWPHMQVWYVAMNLPEQVFKPMVSLASPVKPSVYAARGELPAEELGVTGYGYGEAYQLAMQHARDLKLEEPITELYYSFEYNFYGAGFGDHASNQGNAWVFFHGTDGQLLGKEIPGQGTLGERFFQLQAPIHGGRILGMPGRFLIAALGLAIFVLSVTGVVIWWRKRQARQLRRV